jgi:hypothetical protein
MALSLLLTGACVNTSGGPAPTTAPHRTAVEACLAALSGGQWQVAAEVDRPASSAVILVADTNMVTCMTTHSNAAFGPTMVGTGTYPIPAGSPLSYLTSVLDPGDKEPLILAGRVPPGTATVTLYFADDTAVSATIGTGVWLALLETSDRPVRIEALDAAGAVVGRLQNPAGIEPRG